MKAAILYKPGDLRIENLPTPSFGDEGILLKVGSCAICGTCHFCRKGFTNLRLTFKQTTEAFGYSYPGGLPSTWRYPPRR